MKKLYKPLTESMVTHGGQRIILLLILAFFSQSIWAQTIDFNEITDASDTDIGATYTSGNFRLTMTNGTFMVSDNGNGATKGVRPVVTSGVPLLTIETLDGADFHFESLYIDPGAIGTLTFSSIEGFKNGLSTGSKSDEVNNSGVLAMEDFLDDVDKVVMTPTFFAFATLDDFVFSAPSAAANVAPLVTAPTAPIVTEDATDVAIADDIQLAEADLEDSHTLTFTIIGGTLSLGESGITFGGNGNKSASFTAQGSVTDLNTAMDAATFTATPDLSGIGAASISFVANDGKADSNTASVTFDITGVNDIPVFSSTPVTTVDQDKKYSYTVMVSDADNDGIFIKPTTKPDWLSIQASANTEWVVDTFAGSGANGAGDGPGTSATFTEPSGIAIDASGTLYVADEFKIRKVDRDGVVTTFAGADSGGSFDGTGTSATFQYIHGLALDASGNLYVCDVGNYSIRKITPQGVVTTFAGSGTSGVVDGTGTQASFVQPVGIDIDKSGNLYVGDGSGHRLRKITPDGVVSTLAGNGTAGAQDGTGSTASFNYPDGVAVDDAGIIYVTDWGGNSIRKVSPDGVVTTLAGSGAATSIDGTGTAASFTQPLGITLDVSGNIFVSEADGNRIRKITPEGIVSTIAGSGDTGYADGVGTSALFHTTRWIDTDANGNLYVTDRHNRRIRVLTPQSYDLTGDASAEKGLHNVVLNANDLLGASATQSFSIFVSGTVEFDAATSNANESESSSNIPVSLSKVLTTEGSVDYAISGTAQNGSDYTLSAGTLTFAAGDLTKNITISGIVDDTEIEANETIILTLSNAVGIDLGNQNVHTFTINDNDVSAANAGADQNVCGTSTFMGAFAVGFNETGTWSIISGTGGSFADLNDPVSSFSGTAGVTYTLRWTVSKGDFSDSDEVTIRLFSNVTVSAAGPDQQVRNSTTLAANAAGSGETGTWTQIAGPGNILYADANSPTTTVTASHEGRYTLRWTISNAVCPNSTDDVDIEILPNNAPTFTSTAITSVDDDSDYSYAITTSDADGDDITVTATTKPDWLVLNRQATVSTFVGSGSGTNIDGVGTAASIASPYGLAIDASDNLYLSGYGQLIHKITPAGVVSTLAGSGYGFANGIGTAATFANPSEIAVDAAGNLFIADFSNHVIRKISTNGEVSTFAGAVGVSDKVDGTGTDARFSGPVGLTIDTSNNLYVAEITGNLIRKITPQGAVSTFAGSGSGTSADGPGTFASFNGPNSIDMDASGNLYVTEQNSHNIRKITPDRIVTTIAGTGSSGSADGMGTEASFDTPFGIMVDDSNNLYVTELGNHTIRKILPTGEVSTLVGLAGTTGTTNGEGTSARLSRPVGLVQNSSGDLFVAELGNHLIRRIAINQTVLSGSAVGQSGIHDVTLTGNDGHGSTVEQSFSITVNDATAPVLTSATTANFAENGTGTVYTVTATDVNEITYSLGTGNDEALFDINANTGLVTFKTAPDFENPTDTNTDNAYVMNVIASDGTNSANQNVTITVTNVNEVPTFASTAVTSVNDNTSYNYSIKTSDPDGDALTVTATQKPDWLQLTSTPGGKVATVAGDQNANTITNGPDGTFTGLQYLTTDAQGNIYATETTNNIVRKIAVDGTVSTIAGSPGQSGDVNGTGTESRLQSPAGIAVDADGNAYVSDTGNNKIRKITPEGVVSTFAGSGSTTSSDGTGTEAGIRRPIGMDIDAAGNLYVTSDNTIRKITPAGVVTTLAGQFFNDNYQDGTAADARFGNPTILKLDSEGNIYVLDGAIRKLSKDGMVSTLYNGGNISGAFGMTVDENGNVYFTSESTAIYKLEKGGDVVLFAGNSFQSGSEDGDGADPTTARFIALNEMNFAPNGDLLVADGSVLIRKITFPSEKLSGDATGLTGTHNVTLKADDGNEGTVEQSFIITVNDATDPVFTSATAVNFAENGSGTAYTVTATDLNELTYSLGSDNDEALFVINAGTGLVTFKSSPDFECPADANTDNAYVINVMASDGSNAVNQDVTITVTNVDEAPEFLSDAVTSVDDNKDYSYNIRVSDQEGDNLTVTATIKPDWLNLTLDEPLSVSTIAGSGETDGDGTGVSKDGIGTEAAFGFPRTIVTDGSGNIYMTDLVAGAIRKIDQNAVVTTIAGNTTYEHKDGSGTNASFNDLNDMALGPQGNLYITSGSSIRKMTPQGVVSTLAGSSDGSTGYMDGTGSEALFSALSGITYDAVTNALYVTDIRNARIRKVTLDGAVTTFAGSGTVGNDDGTASVASFNSPQDIVVDSKGNFYVADAQSRRVRKITASGMVSTFAGSSSGFKDGKGTAAQFDYFTGMTIDNEDILYVADAENNRIRRISPEGVVSTLLGGEQGYIDGDINVARLTRPQYLAVDTDQNLILIEGGLRLRRVNVDRGNQLKGSPVGQKGTFNVTLSLTDGTNDPVTQSFTVTVNDVTKPVFTSTETATFEENGTGTVYTVLAMDTNPITYSLAGDNDEALFNIDGTSGAVSFKTSPDFENPSDGDANNTYVINVIASDGINSVNQDVTITVTNVDDTDPVFTSATAVDFAENGTGTAYTVAATDANVLTYSLGSGNDEALFNITAGEVTFKTSPDFENPVDANTDNAYVVNVIASDGINSVNQDVTITVTNVDDTDPVFTSASAVDFAENGTGTAYTVVATDANVLTYSLGSGNDEALFVIAAGEVTFKSSPDFENPTDADVNNTYVINVIASDGINTANQDVTITVTNVDDTDPVFTSATAVDFAENGTGTAYTVAATDANTVTYSLGSGNDEALFDIAAGKVTFKSSPDFENPTDADANNTYVINVIASDGINTANQDVTITVTNVDDTDPVFTSSSAVDFAENGTGTAYTVAATDANEVTYSLGSQKDETLFNMDQNSGVVTFKTAPDFENPVDSDADNAYVINVIASDGINSVNQDVTITVTDVDEIAPSVSITSSTTSITSGVFTVTVEYSEVVSGFAVGDISVTNGAAGNFTSVTAGRKWTADITPAADGAVTVNIAAASATDATGNENTPATEFSIVNDETAPGVTLSAGALTGDVYTVTAQFSESVSGFDLGDVTIAGGTGSEFTAVDGDTYTFSVSSANPSATMDIAAGVSTDAAGNENTVSNQLSLVFNSSPSDIALSNASIDENSETGTIIGSFSTTDTDVSDSHTYALVSGDGDTDNASFTIEGTSLKAAKVFDFETKPNYSIRVKTDDGRGGSFEKAFTISIDNVAEPEVIVSGTVDFPETQLGITVSTMITISNIGEAPVEVIASSAPADFSVTPGSVILMAGESRQVNVNFTPTQEATYSGNLVFTYNGLQATLPVSGIGAIVTGIDDEWINENEIRLYPNPVSDIVNVDLSQVRAPALDIILVNASGKAVNGWKDYRQKQLSIHVTDLDNGLYIMQFTDGKSVVRKKVIIRK